MLYKLFIWCICILSILGDSCTFGDLSLSHFTHSTITCLYSGNQSEINPAETNRFTIGYTACNNGIDCPNIDGKNYHLIRHVNNGNCNSFSGYLYNPDNQPVKSTYNGKESYYFYYTQVGSSLCPSQTWTRIQFVCDDELYNEHKLKCFDFFDENGACALVMIVPTSAAGIDTVAGKLSGGSIFLIILFVTVTLYVFIGYIWNGYKNKNWKRIDNIPHYEFWKFLPAYVKVGCGISYQWVTSKVNGDKQYAMQQTSDP
eukprot:92466_1